MVGLVLALGMLFGQSADQEPPFGLTPRLARVAACESANFNPYFVYGPGRGRQGEIGLMQLHPRGELPTFYSYGYDDPWDPWQQAAFAYEAFENGLAPRWSCARLLGIYSP